MWVLHTLFWALLGYIIGLKVFSIGIRSKIWGWKGVILHSATSSAYFTAIVTFNNNTTVLEEILLFLGFGLFGVLPCAFILNVFSSNKK